MASLVLAAALPDHRAGAGTRGRRARRRSAGRPGGSPRRPRARGCLASRTPTSGSSLPPAPRRAGWSWRSGRSSPAACIWTAWPTASTAWPVATRPPARHHAGQPGRRLRRGGPDRLRAASLAALAELPAASRGRAAPGPGDRPARAAPDRAAVLAGHQRAPSRARVPRRAVALGRGASLLAALGLSALAARPVGPGGDRRAAPRRPRLVGVLRAAPRRPHGGCARLRGRAGRAGRARRRVVAQTPGRACRRVVGVLRHLGALVAASSLRHLGAL